MGRSTSTSASKSDLFIAVLTAVLVFLMAARTPLDSDLFWHLRAGADTLANARPVLVDTFSYTRAGEPWVNHSWLGQVVLALVYQAAGWMGLAGLVAGVAAFLAVLLFRRMSGPALWRAFLIILSVLVAAPVLSPRPQIFSLLMLVLLDWLAERRLGSLPLRLALAAGLFALWSNLHGGYVLGIILLVSVSAGEWVDRLGGRPEGGTRAVLEPLAMAAVGFAAAALNPNGAAMWRIPFQTVGVGALQSAIPEWASPDFHDLVQQPFLWMLAGLLGALGFAGRPAAGRDLVKVVVFACMGLVARRNFAPFALMAAPLLSTSGWMVLSRILTRLVPRRSESRPLPLWLRRVTNLFLVGLLALVGMGKLVYAAHPAVVSAYMVREYPQAAVDFLRANRPDGQLFSTYGWGGFLIWAMPEYPVFIDGRTDLYGDAVIGDWLAIMAAREDAGGPGWEELLARRGVAQALLPAGMPLLREMERAGWTTLYADTQAVVMRRPE